MFGYVIPHWVEPRRLVVINSNNLVGELKHISLPLKTSLKWPCEELHFLTP